MTKRKPLTGDKTRYVPYTPRKIPAGEMLAHNHILHTPWMTVGHNGFRCWFVRAGHPDYEPCPCGWAPHLPEHYRVIDAGSYDYDDEVMNALIEAFVSNWADRNEISAQIDARFEELEKEKAA
jgi:hypothetical protein